MTSEQWSFDIWRVVFSHLDPHDYYTCLSVSKGFHALATPFLYRDLSFYLHPQLVGRRDSQARLLKCLSIPTDKLSYIRRLSIIFNPVHHPNNIKSLNISFDFTEPVDLKKNITSAIRPVLAFREPMFGHRIAHILERASGLQYVEVVNELRPYYKLREYIGLNKWTLLESETRKSLFEVLGKLLVISSRPKVSLKLYHQSSEDSGAAVVEGDELACAISRRLKVVSLDVVHEHNAEVAAPLDFVTEFRDLSQLGFGFPLPFHTAGLVHWQQFSYGALGIPLIDLSSTAPEDPVDLMELLPPSLTKMNLACGEFSSLPLSLRSLDISIFAWDQWLIICHLQYLETLNLHCKFRDCHDNMAAVQFNSHNLRMFTVHCCWIPPERIFKSIKPGAFKLETIIITGWDPIKFSPSILGSSFVGPSLKRFHADLGFGRYPFDDLIDQLKGTPNLTTLTVPLNIERLRSLSLTRFQKIITLCPKLIKMTLIIAIGPPDPILENVKCKNAVTRKFYKTVGLSYDEDICLKKHFGTIQSFDHAFCSKQYIKMTLFASSPCVQFCSILYVKNFLAMDIHLDHVQKHMGLPFLFVYPFTYGNRCQKGCTLLADGLIVSCQTNGRPSSCNELDKTRARVAVR